MSGILIRVTGRYVELIWFGLSLMVLAFGLFIHLVASSTTVEIVLFQIVAGIGHRFELFGATFRTPGSNLGERQRDRYFDIWLYSQLVYGDIRCDCGCCIPEWNGVSGIDVEGATGAVDCSEVVWKGGCCQCSLSEHARLGAKDCGTGCVRVEFENDVDFVHLYCRVWVDCQLPCYQESFEQGA